MEWSSAANRTRQIIQNLLTRGHPLRFEKKTGLPVIEISFFDLFWASLQSGVFRVSNQLKRSILKKDRGGPKAPHRRWPRSLSDHRKKLFTLLRNNTGTTDQQKARRTDGRMTDGRTDGRLDSASFKM